MAKETIEVLYALMDKSGTYSKFAGTSICSMFENTREKVRVHIFHDGSIEGENKKNFEILADRYGQEIILYNVRQLLPQVWAEAERIKEEAVNDDRYTEATLYRLLAPQVLSETVRRLIYIDADTIVNIDIKRLWQEKIGASGMSAVLEQDMMSHYGKRITAFKTELVKLMKYWESLGVKVETTFNAGILLMDLDKLRSMGNLLLEGLRVALGCDVKNNFYDQNILNFYFARGIGHLPWYYNILQRWDKKFKSESDEMEGIYHYMGRSLLMDEEDSRDTIFYDYFIKTPWMQGKVLCRFFYSMEGYYLRYMEKKMVLMRQLTANLAGKKLVLAASLRKEAQALSLCESPADFKLEATHPLEVSLPIYLQEPEERAKEEAKNPEANIKRSVFPENVTYHFLGSDKHLNLNLPYDVDSYFYLFFVEDYMFVKIALEKAGLPEEGHYMNGNFLIENIIEGGAINPNKFIDKL